MFRAAERYKTLAVPLAKKLLSLQSFHQFIVGQYSNVWKSRVVELGLFG